MSAFARCCSSRFGKAAAELQVSEQRKESDNRFREQLVDAQSIAIQYVMNTLRAITVRLDPVDYARLEAEAERLGVPPATLVRMYVRGRPSGDDTEGERRRRIGPQALDQLADLTADLPPVDAAQIAHESREALEARPSL